MAGKAGKVASARAGNGTALADRARDAAAREAERIAYEAEHGKARSHADVFVLAVAVLTGVRVSEIDVLEERTPSPSGFGSRQWITTAEAGGLTFYGDRHGVRMKVQCSDDDCANDASVAVRTLADIGRALDTGIPCAAHKRKSFGDGTLVVGGPVYPDPEPGPVSAWPASIPTLEEQPIRTFNDAFYG